MVFILGVILQDNTGLELEFRVENYGSTRDQFFQGLEFRFCCNFFNLEIKDLNLETYSFK